MKTITCDRCNSAEGIQNVTLPYIGSGMDAGLITQKIDLCRGCLRDLGEWMKPTPK